MPALSRGYCCNYQCLGTLSGCVLCFFLDIGVLLYTHTSIIFFFNLAGLRSNILQNPWIQIFGCKWWNYPAMLALRFGLFGITPCPLELQQKNDSSTISLACYFATLLSLFSWSLFTFIDWSCYKISGFGCFNWKGRCCKFY